MRKSGDERFTKGENVVIVRQSIFSGVGGMGTFVNPSTNMAERASLKMRCVCECVCVCLHVICVSECVCVSVWRGCEMINCRADETSVKY